MSSRRLLLLLLFVAFAAKAEEVACKAMLAGTRALVDATVHGLLDSELLRIVKLGVTGKLTVQTQVVRRKRLWFGRVVAASARELPLTWSEERGVFQLDGHAITDPEHVSLERIVLPMGESEDPRAYEVEITTRLVVVTPGSLGHVLGENDSALARTVLGAIASDLTRTASSTCAVAPRP